MKLFFKRALLICGFALTAANAIHAVAADAQYYYYDGKQKIPLTRDPALLAEFGAGAASNTIPDALPGASVAIVSGGATLYTLPQNLQNSGAVTNLLSGSTAGVSPVFHQGSSMSGPLMALPGGIIVEFNGWDDAKVRSWAAARGYTVQQRLEVPGPQNDWYLLQTSAGLNSLDTSNTLQESGEVISASPNWWRNHVTK